MPEVVDDYWHGLRDGFFGPLALEEVKRGRRIGACSKLLDHFTLLLQVFGIAHILSRREWIAAAVVIVTVFVSGPIWMLLALGAFVYLIYLGDFIGAAIFTCSFLIAAASRQIAFRNAKNELVQSKTGVSPFEGLSLRLGLAIQCASVVTAYLTTGLLSICAWGVFVLAIAHALLRYCNRLYPKWARLHFPVMMRWSALSGIAAAHAELGQPVDATQYLRELALSVYPHRGLHDAEELVETADMVRRELVDQRMMRDFFEKRGLFSNSTAMDEIMEAMRKMLLNEEDVGLRVRYVIGELVASDFGETERDRYMAAVFMNKAR